MIECAFVKGKDCYSWCKACDDGKCLRLLPAEVKITGSITINTCDISEKQLNDAMKELTRDIEEITTKKLQEVLGKRR